MRGQLQLTLSMSFWLFLLAFFSPLVRSLLWGDCHQRESPCWPTALPRSVHLARWEFTETSCASLCSTERCWIRARRLTSAPKLRQTSLQCLM